MFKKQKSKKKKTLVNKTIAMNNQKIEENQKFREISDKHHKNLMAIKQVNTKNV